MTYYIRQADRYSCGPVALQNLLIWVGIKDSRFSYEKLHSMCHCEEGKGTSTRYFHETLQFITDRSVLQVDKFSYFPTIGEITKHLKAVGVIILKYHWDQMAYTGEHYVFISEIIDNKFSLINDDNPEAGYPIIELVIPRKLKRYLLPYEYAPNAKYSEPQDYKYPCAWFLNRY